jgi:predicted RNA-binding protein with PIN domain
MMGPRCIIIDGYNVIRNTPGLAAAEARGLAQGREALLARVEAAYRRSPDRVLVVFDGNGERETARSLRCGAGSQQIYARRGTTADAAILRLADEWCRAGAEVTVASDDRGVRAGAGACGARGIAVRELADRLNAAPRHLEKQARHRATVRDVLERREREDADRGRPRGGNPHRAPRRRRQPRPEPPR